MSAVLLNHFVRDLGIEAGRIAHNAQFAQCATAASPKHLRPSVEARRVPNVVLKMSFSRTAPSRADPLRAGQSGCLNLTNTS